MSNYKLTMCPFCGSELVFENINSNNNSPKIINTKSEEHIIPKSLGNEKFVLPKGTICDKCNNYFALNIEKQFLEIESISILRSYHLIPSRKNKVPAFNVLFCGDNAIMRYDKKTHSMIMDVKPETVLKLYSGEKPSYFFSKGIDTDELRNNYIVSRMLVKIFIEVYLYYSIIEMKQYENINDDYNFVFDTKMKELINYVRYGKKDKIYEYTVQETKSIIPYSNDDFVASIDLTCDSNGLSGMVFKLFELQFTLKIN